MERKLQLLDSFDAYGDDGLSYRVLGYEHLVCDEASHIDGQEHWQSTGQAEYRLADGRRVDIDRNEVMRIGGVVLRTAREHAAEGRTKRSMPAP